MVQGFALVHNSRKEVIMTLAMYQLDGVRIRMPLACSVIAALVLVVATALALIAPKVDPGESTLHQAQSAQVNEIEGNARPGTRF
jgi:hypothetical protein